MSTTDFKKYLPSKKFTYSLLVIIVILALFFLVKELFSLVKNSIESKKSAEEKTGVTVEEIVQEDSNNNGIPDWEEYIWGLDPTKNGPENKEFVLAKKKSLTESGSILESVSNKEVSDNELMSRQLLATVIALQESGQLDDQTVNTISNAIGQNIIAEEIPDTYFLNDLSIIPSSAQSEGLYYRNFVDVYQKYQDKDIGSEIVLISQGLGSNDVQALRTAKTIAECYREFAGELAQIEVPSSLKDTHLKLINNLVKVASSIEGLTMSMADQILGMKSIIQYNKYSEDLISNIDELSSILQIEY
jgi:hypothetical protein